MTNEDSPHLGWNLARHYLSAPVLSDFAASANRRLPKRPPLSFHALPVEWGWLVQCVCTQNWMHCPKQPNKLNREMEQTYPSEWLSVLAPSHGWLIALIAEEAGFCVCSLFSPSKRWAGDGHGSREKNGGWKCEMTIVMSASYRHTREARKQMWQVSDWDL